MDIRYWHHWEDLHTGETGSDSLPYRTFRFLLDTNPDASFERRARGTARWSYVDGPYDSPTGRPTKIVLVARAVKGGAL